MAQRIGEFLVSIGAISANQCKVILEIQQSGDERKFGEIALAAGFVDPDSLKCFTDHADTTSNTI